MNYIMSCGNSQVQKLVSDMTSTCQHLLMSANICQRLPAPTSWCPHATHITCAELEFWLEAFLHAANPQGLEVVQPLPQLSTIVATHPTNNS